jgi:hypothetical protein
MVFPLYHAKGQVVQAGSEQHPIEEIIGIPYTCVAKKVLTAVWKIPF